jgi:transposase
MDGAYDSQSLREFIARKGEKAVIPFRKNSKYPGEFDKDLYKDRHLIECLFCHMKNYRRIATRFDFEYTPYLTKIFNIVNDKII